MTKPQTLALLATVLAVAFSCFNPPYPHQLLLQHIPTALGLALVVWFMRRHPLSNRSFAAVLGFTLLHALGARYLYTYVPYDAWSTSLFGVSISELFGFHRNHYDRLIHFTFGLLIAAVMREIGARHLGLSRRMAAYVAVEFVMACSMFYEVAEWLVAVFLSAGVAEAYNGQQGDMWDAQKDMALAMLGALVTIGVGAIRRRVSARRHANGFPDPRQM